MTSKQAQALAYSEAQKIISELRDDLALASEQVANVRGALAVAFMRGMIHAAEGVGDELRDNLKTLDPKGRHS